MPPWGLGVAFSQLDRVTHRFIPNSVAKFVLIAVLVLLVGAGISACSNAGCPAASVYERAAEPGQVRRSKPQGWKTPKSSMTTTLKRSAIWYVCVQSSLSDMDCLYFAQE